MRGGGDCWMDADVGVDDDVGGDGGMRDAWVGRESSFLSV